MKNSKRFNKRVSKKHVNQISSYRSYESPFPGFVYVLLLVGIVAALIALIFYCNSLK